MNETASRVLALLDEAYTVRINSLKKSLALAREALALSRQLNADALEAKCLSRMALFEMINSEFDAAIAHAEEAMAKYLAVADERGVADAQFTIASVYYKTDNLHLGLKYLVDCLTIYRKFEDYPNQAKSYKSLGTIYEFFGDTDNAIQSYLLAIEAADKAGDLNLKTNVLNPLSGIYLNRNDLAGAMELIEESIRIKKQSGDVRGLAFAYYGRGKVFTQLERYDLAEEDFNTSLRIHGEMGEKLGQGMTLRKMGVLYLKMGDANRAKEKLNQALDMSLQYKSRMIKTTSSFLLYQIYKAENNLAEALRYLEIYQEELDATTHNQTRQIITSYNLIHRMEAKSIEDRMQIEKAEMEEKKNKAEYAARAKQEFLSNMSHEIRTPLNAIITITHLFRERTDPEEQQLMDSLKFASNNLLLLINDVLDFTKLEIGKVQLENRPHNLRSMVSNISSTYESMAREKGIGMVLEVDESIAENYEVDEIKLMQILGNLLSNAIKFTTAGQVTMKVRQTGTSETADELEFSVTDTGIGIPEDFLGEIFEAFTQPRSVTTKTHHGSGLGLAIVKKLVELYDSRLELETKEGRGSRFSFILQLKPAMAPAAAASKANHSLRGLKVLLAEDNQINILVAEKLMSKWDIRADVAKNGKEAIDMAGKKKYEVILMDIHMPVMNGYDAVEQIRQAGQINRQTPVYALTADITAGLEHKNGHFFNGFLRKPIEVEQLFEVLTNIV